MAAQLEPAARLAATGEADLPRPLLDVHAGLTSGHASVTPNCEADDEQSRCRLFAPTQVPAATRAAPQRPSIPQAQAVQTPAVADEVLGGRWTLHPCGRATGVQLRLQPGPDPHRQPGGAVRGNDRGQRLHGRQSHRIRRRAPPARRTAVGPSGGARADARGTSAASTIVRGRSWEIPTTPADARPTSSHRRWSRAGRGAEKAGWWPGLLPYFPSPDGPATAGVGLQRP